MEKSKAEKSPWVKKTKKSRPKEERNSSTCQGKKITLPKATKAFGLAQRLRQSWRLLKIQSVRISLEQVA